MLASSIVSLHLRLLDYIHVSICDNIKMSGKKRERIEPGDEEQLRVKKAKEDPKHLRQSAGEMSIRTQRRFIKACCCCNFTRRTTILRNGGSIAVTLVTQKQKKKSQMYGTNYCLVA